jgi:hypothetical protein
MPNPNNNNKNKIYESQGASMNHADAKHLLMKSNLSNPNVQQSQGTSMPSLINHIRNQGVRNPRCNSHKDQKCRCQTTSIKSTFLNPKVQQSQGTSMPMPNNYNETEVFESQGATVTQIKHADAKKPF